MIDLLNINTETINTFKKINCNKTLIISKLDIIPKSIKESLIIEWLKEEYNIENNIIFLSTKKNINTKQLIKMLTTKGYCCIIYSWNNIYIERTTKQ